MEARLEKVTLVALVDIDMAMGEVMEVPRAAMPATVAGRVGTAAQTALLSGVRA